MGAIFKKIMAEGAGLTLRRSAILLLASITSCSPTDRMPQFRPEIAVASGQAESAIDDQGGGTGLASALVPGDSGGQTARVRYFDGSGVFAVASAAMIPAYTSEEGGFTLNFNNAAVRTVVSAILGDMLGLRFEVHPAVQGTMTLQSNTPIGANALLPSLESALRILNFAILDVNGVLHILPAAEAPKRITAFRQGLPRSVNLPGFGVQIVPLLYTSPTEMRKVLQPFAPQGGIIRVDEARNMLIIAGTSQELATMLQTIRTFDVDWMKGMSFALYDLEYVEAKTLTDELLQIFGDANSPLAGMVRLIPIPRLNSILGISAQPDYLRQVEDWIGRLDIGGSTPGRRIYVYGVKNARAGDLASALGNILATQTAGRQASQQPAQGAAAIRQLNQSARQNGPGVGTTGRGVPTQAAAAQPSVFEAGGLRIMANEEANALLILATPSEYGVIKAALRQMDVRPRQVLIEATLAEVTLTDELRYGVQWFFEFGDNSVAFSSSPSGGVASQFPGFSYVFAGSADARTVLNALSSVTDVDVISSPKLMVLNNHTATLQVGDQVPVAVQSAVSTTNPDAPIVNSVQFRDTGVILTVTPRIGEGGAVMLDIEQEISDVVSTTTSGIDSPTIRQRKISTSVIVQDGDTIALGGLIRESISRGKSGIPLLKDIPLIGNLFSSTDRVRRRTELIILITPRIVQDTREAREILDYLRRQFQAVLGPSEQP